MGANKRTRRLQFRAAAPLHDSGGDGWTGWVGRRRSPGNNFLVEMLLNSNSIVRENKKQKKNKWNLFLFCFSKGRVQLALNVTDTQPHVTTARKKNKRETRGRKANFQSGKWGRKGRDTSSCCYSVFFFYFFPYFLSFSFLYIVLHFDSLSRACLSDH